MDLTEEFGGVHDYIQKRVALMKELLDDLPDELLDWKKDIRRILRDCKKEMEEYLTALMAYESKTDAASVGEDV